MTNRLTNWFDQLMLTSAPREPIEVARAADPYSDPYPVFTFFGWPKTARLLRDIVITEKLDGTNAGIMIQQVTAERYVQMAYDLFDENGTLLESSGVLAATSFDGGDSYWLIGAQSRNRVISVHKDNQGFAKWVRANARTLIEDLGPSDFDHATGQLRPHFGEFWGKGIGRNYGLTENRFSLFNPSFGFGEGYGYPAPSELGTYQVKTPGLGKVPVLYEGPFETRMIKASLAQLNDFGSLAAPGFMRPEGVVVYHTHARKILGKVTLDSQDAGKWEPVARSSQTV